MACGVRLECTDGGLPLSIPPEVQDIALSVGTAVNAEPALVSRIHDPNAETLWCLEVVLCQGGPD